MRSIVGLYKSVGVTPLQAITELRNKYPKFKDEKIAYAGRLDPMAEGLLLLLIGEETKNRDKYQGLKKVYEFEALLGVETDSYDLLGILKNTQICKLPKNYVIKTKDFISSRLGTWTQTYPAYSSKAVNGKKLFEWAREGKIDQIQVPSKDVKIYSFSLNSERKISTQQLSKYVNKHIREVEGYFQQEETLKLWKDFCENNKDTELTLLKFTVECSSGTYVRGMINDLGKYLKCGALAFSIKRLKVGTYDLPPGKKMQEYI